MTRKPQRCPRTGVVCTPLISSSIQRLGLSRHANWNYQPIWQHGLWSTKHQGLYARIFSILRWKCSSFQSGSWSRICSILLSSNQITSIQSLFQKRQHCTQQTNPNTIQRLLICNTYLQLVGDVLVGRVEFLNKIFGLFYDDLVRLPIEAIDNRNWVFLPVLHPPGLKSQTLNLIYTAKGITTWRLLLFLMRESLRALMR